MTARRTSRRRFHAMASGYWSSLDIPRHGGSKVAVLQRCCVFRHPDVWLLRIIYACAVWLELVLSLTCPLAPAPSFDWIRYQRKTSRDAGLRRHGYKTGRQGAGGAALFLAAVKLLVIQITRYPALSLALDWSWC
jgi:hypothetical protein